MRADTGNEKWLPVAKQPHYEVSDQGRVRSLDRTVPFRGRFKTIAGRVLKASHNTSGYLKVCLFSHGVSEQIFVQRLVLETFVGPRPNGSQACHGNGDRTDNRLANLRWDTAKANHADRVAHGTMHGRILGRPCPRLTFKQQIEIHAMVAAGFNKTQTARLAGVPRTTVNSLLKREVSRA